MLQIRKQKVIKNITFAFFGLFCFVLMYTQVHSQKKMNIDGYLIDAKNNPLVDGAVTLFYNNQVVTNDGLTQSWNTFEDGSFAIEATWKQGKKIYLLMEDRPFGFYPIDTNILINKKFFKGIIISRFRKVIHLYSVRNYITYGQIIIDTTKNLPSFKAKVLKNQIHLKVRTTDGEILCDTSFAPAYSKESEKVTFQIPEGIWYVELTDMTTGKVILPYKKAVITKSKSFEVFPAENGDSN